MITKDVQPDFKDEPPMNRKNSGSKKRSRSESNSETQPPPNKRTRYETLKNSNSTSNKISNKISIETHNSLNHIHPNKENNDKNTINPPNPLLNRVPKKKNIINIQLIPNDNNPSISINKSIIKPTNSISQPLINIPKSVTNSSSGIPKTDNNISLPLTIKIEPPHKNGLSLKSISDPETTTIPTTIAISQSQSHSRSSSIISNSNSSHSSHSRSVSPSPSIHSNTSRSNSIHRNIKKNSKDKKSKKKNKIGKDNNKHDKNNGNTNSTRKKYDKNNSSSRSGRSRQSRHDRDRDRDRIRQSSSHLMKNKDRKGESYRDRDRDRNRRDRDRRAHHNALVVGGQHINFPKTNVLPSVLQNRGNIRCINNIGIGNNVQQQQQKFKTTLCSNYMSGDCRFGVRCHFAHGSNELRGYGAGSEAEKIWRSKPCKEYIKGTCHWGAKCRFAHGNVNNNNNKIGRENNIPIRNKSNVGSSCSNCLKSLAMVDKYKNENKALKIQNQRYKQEIESYKHQSNNSGSSRRKSSK